MKDYKKLKEIIYKANPEIMERETLYRCNRVREAWEMGWETMAEDDFEEAGTGEIRLSDILFTMKKLFQFQLYDVLTVIDDWDLKEDNLDWHHKNKQKVVKYLIDLLVYYR